MKANKKTILFLILSVLLFLLPGCSILLKPVELTLGPDYSTQKQKKSSSMSKRFEQSPAKAPTAVDSAIELSNKYAELSEEMTLLRQKKQQFLAENTRLKHRLAILEPQLKQTQKELTEANDLLIEMRIELNNWKIDILGFRDELREADITQLETLHKILEILGGEVLTESSQDKAALTASPNKPPKPHVSETPTSGKSK